MEYTRREEQERQVALEREAAEQEIVRVEASYLMELLEVTMKRGPFRKLMQRLSRFASMKTYPRHQQEVLAKDVFSIFYRWGGSGKKFAGTRQPDVMHAEMLYPELMRFLSSDGAIEFGAFGAHADGAAENDPDAPLAEEDADGVAVDGGGGGGSGGGGGGGGADDSVDPHVAAARERAHRDAVRAAWRQHHADTFGAGVADLTPPEILGAEELLRFYYGDDYPVQRQASRLHKQHLEEDVCFRILQSVFMAVNKTREEEMQVDSDVREAVSSTDAIPLNMQIVNECRTLAKLTHKHLSPLRLLAFYSALHRYAVQNHEKDFQSEWRSKRVAARQHRRREMKALCNLLSNEAPRFVPLIKIMFDFERMSAARSERTKQHIQAEIAALQNSLDDYESGRRQKTNRSHLCELDIEGIGDVDLPDRDVSYRAIPAGVALRLTGAQRSMEHEDGEDGPDALELQAEVLDSPQYPYGSWARPLSSEHDFGVPDSGRPRVWVPETSMSPMSLARTEADKRRHAIDIRRAKLPHLDKEIKRAKNWESAMENDLAAAMTSYAAGVHTLVAVRFMLKQIGTRNEDAAWDWDDIHTDHARVHQLVQSRTRTHEPEGTSQGFWGQVRGAVRAATGAGESGNASTPLPSPSARLANRFSSLLTREEYRSCYKLILNYQVQMKGDAASREGLLASLRKICGEESWPLVEPLVEEHLADFDVQYMIMQQWQAPPSDEDSRTKPADVVEDPDFRIRNRPMHDSIGRFALDRGVQSMTQQDMIDLGIEARRRLKERKSRGAHGRGDWGFAVRTSSPEEQLEQAGPDHELYEDDTPQQRVGRVLDTYLTLSEILAQKQGRDSMAPIQTTFERPANEKYKVFVDQLPMYATLEDVRDCLALCGPVIHVSKSNGFLDEMRRIKSQRVRAGMRLKQQKEERYEMRQQRMAKFAEIQAQREQLKETKASMKEKSKDPETLRKTYDLHTLFKAHFSPRDSFSLGDFREVAAQYTRGGPQHAGDGSELDEDFPLDRIFAAAVNETVLRRKLGLQLPLGGPDAYEATAPTLDELRVLTQFRHGKKLIQKVFVKLHHIEDAKDDPRKDRLLLVKGLVEQLRQEQHEARIERERQRRELKLPSSRLEASVNADSLMQMLDMLAEKTDAPLGTASARDGQPWTLMTSTQEDGASDLEMLAGICAVHGLRCTDVDALDDAHDSEVVDETDDNETKQLKRLSKHILTAHRDRKTQFQHTTDQREMDKKRAKLAKKHELAKWRKERGLPAKASGFAKPRAGINERQKDLSREFPALSKRSNYSAFLCFEDEASMKRALIPELQIFGMLFNSPLRSEEEYVAHNRPQVVDMVLSQGPPRQEFLKAMAALHVALNDLEQSSENSSILRDEGVGHAQDVDDTVLMLPESASHLFDFDVHTPFTEDDLGYGRTIKLNGISGPVTARDGMCDGDVVVAEQSLSKQVVGKFVPPPDGTLVFRAGSSVNNSAEEGTIDLGSGAWRHGVVDGTVLLNGGAVSALSQALHKHDHVFQELKYVRTFEEALNLRDSEGLDIYRSDEAKRNELISAGLERALFWRQEDEDALKRGLITLVAASAKKQKHDAKRFGKGRKKIEDVTRRQHEAKKDIDALFSRTLRSEFKLMCDKLSKQGDEDDDDDDDDDVDNDEDVGDEEDDEDEDDDEDMDELEEAEDDDEDDEDVRGRKGREHLPLFHSLLYGQEKQTLQELGDKAYEEVMQQEREEAYRDAYEMALQLAGVSEAELDATTRAVIEDEARQAETLAAHSARWAALTAMNYARDRHAMSEASDFSVFADVWEENIAKMKAEEASSRRCRIVPAEEKTKLHVQYPLALEKHGVHERKQQWPLVEDVLKELDKLAGPTARLELGDESLDSGRVSRKRFCVIDFPSHEQASAVAKALDGKTFMDAMGNLRRVHVGWWS